MHQTMVNGTMTTQMAEATTQTSPSLYGLITELKSKRRRDHLDSAIDTCISALRNLSHFWLTHVILIVILVAYTVGGAYLFHYFESNASQELLQHSRIVRDGVMQELWTECRTNNVVKDDWISIFKTKHWGYSQELCTPNVWLDENVTIWSVSRAVLYCTSIFTATGYGNIVPTTTSGQMSTIVYAVIGIPYTLAVLLDIGSMLTTVLRKVYIALYKIYYIRKCCWWQGTTHSITSPKYSAQKSTTGSLPSCSAETMTNLESTGTLTVTDARDELYLLTGLKQSDFVIPVWIGIILIMIYALIGALIFNTWEAWSYRESLYFVFVSLTTIGFGDYIPKHATYAVTFSYVMIGLALVSLFFNLVVERISKAMHKAKRKIRKKLRKDFESRHTLNVLADAATATDEDDEGPITEARGNGKSRSRIKSVITVHLLDKLPRATHTKESVSVSSGSRDTARQRRLQQVHRFRIPPVILLEISDYKLLNYVEYEKTENTSSQKLQEAYITEKALYRYLKERLQAPMD